MREHLIGMSSGITAPFFLTLPNGALAASPQMRVLKLDNIAKDHGEIEGEKKRGSLRSIEGQENSSRVTGTGKDRDITKQMLS